ncbi:hypothetical protein [Flavobacterium cellulosilyticum]|uniref:Beta-lactamase-inhibitor-like PepSY-like domain-containing protein n=1 Tax=Flavobacterium cellulosilyticum TaxID=2541731 RepID=A0A4R5CDK8_9FLAO|nr:hypothetical protein [Flavobacterium cellulosilyticum]TDD97009.1 hypothetical protein E0F76_10245 [Flavobacterium cellulosilyticum]
MSNLFKGILVVLFLSQVSVAKAQNTAKSKLDKNVPAIVLEKFSIDFPTHDPVWFSQYQGRYNQKLVFEGKFIFDNRYSSAVYDINGNLLAFTATVDKYELPEAITAYMTANYPSFPIVETLLVTRDMKDVTYEVGIYIDNQLVIEVFSENGDFIKSTKA